MKHIAACCIALPACLWLAACSRTIVVAEEAPLCPVKESALLARCAAPATIPAGASYESLIETAINDRNALAACSAHQQFLASALGTCNAELKKHNERVRELKEKPVQ